MAREEMTLDKQITRKQAAVVLNIKKKYDSSVDKQEKPVNKKKECIFRRESRRCTEF